MISPLVNRRDVPLCLLGMFICLFMLAVTAAQERRGLVEPIGPRLPAGTSPIIREGSIWYLIDETTGRPIRVANFSIDEWNKLVEYSKRLVPPPPRYVVRRQQFVVQEADQRATVSGEFEVQIVQTAVDKEWVPIQLGLPQTRLTQITATQIPSRESRDRSEKPVVHFTQFTKERGSVCWVEVTRGDRIKIAADFVYSMDPRVAQSQLAITVPTVADTKVTVQAAQPQAVARASEYDVTRRGLDNGTTEFKFACAGGLIRFGWQADSVRMMAALPKLEVATNSETTVLAANRLQTMATLNLTSRRAEISDFVVLLPPKAVWRAQPDEPFSVDRLGTSNDGRQRLRITLSEPGFEVTVRLLVEQLQKSGSEIEVAGFEVEQAVQQQSFLELYVDGEYSIDQRPSNEFRPISVSDREGEKRPAYRYEYFRYPCSMKIKVRREQARIAIDPKYVYYLEEQQIRLAISLECAVRGRGAIQLRIPDPLTLLPKKGSPEVRKRSAWRVRTVSVQPSRFLDQDNSQYASFPITIPIARDPGSSQDSFRIEIQATQAIDAAQVAFAIPRPQTVGDSALVLNPDVVIISPANNIKLTMDDATVGLSQDILPPETSINDLASRPGTLYFRGTGDRVAFAGNLAVQQQSGTVNSAASVALATPRTTIAQTLEYRIDYQGLESVDLDVPQRLLEADQRFEVFLADTGLLAAEPGQTSPQNLVRLRWEKLDDSETGPGKSPTAPQATDDDADNQPDAASDPLDGDPDTSPTNGSSSTPAAATDTPDTRRRIRVYLGRERIGLFKLQLIHSLDFDPGLPEQSRSLVVALAHPVTTARIQYDTPIDLRVSAAADWDTNYEPANWNSEQRRDDGTLERTTRIMDGNASTIHRLQIVRRPQQGSNLTTVERAWLQSYVTDSSRRDRAVFSIVTSENSLTFQLPTGIVQDLNKIRVAIDGVEFDGNLNSDARTLQLALPPNTSDRRTVELWYWFADRGGGGNLELQTPRLIGSERVERMFWQVLVPPNEHLLWLASRDANSQHQWRWSGWWWERAPTQDQRSLEQWAHASPQQELTAQTNTYLFTSIGVVPSIRLVTVDRSVFVGVVAGVVLVLGLALLNLTWLRHPSILFSAAIAAVGTTFANPNMGFLLVQAVTLGAILVVLGAGIRFVFGRETDFEITLDAAPPTDSQTLAPSDSQIPLSNRGSATTVPPATFTDSEPVIDYSSTDSQP